MKDNRLFNPVSGIASCSTELSGVSLSSAEASFALPYVLLGRVGNLEAEERVNESARVHLPHPLGASAEERAGVYSRPAWRVYV